MIKVFQVIPTLGVGGAEHVVLDIANNIDKSKYDMTILTYYEFDKFNIDLSSYDIRVKSFSKKRGIDIKLLYKLTKYIIKEKPDAIHTHIYAAPYVFLGVILSGVKIRLHTVHSVANKELSVKKRKLMKFAYKYLNFMPVAISDYVKQTISKEYQISLDKIPCIYNGVDTKFFTNIKSNKEKDLTIINVARFTDVKNHELLLRAFSIVLKRNKNIKLKLIGNGPLFDKIQILIRELNLEKNVILLGNVNKFTIRQELSKSNIFVLSSKYEGLPLSILEAMSCGLPIISTKVGGVIDIVNDKNGILVEPTKEDLAEAIMFLIKNDSIRNKMGKYAKEFAFKYDVLNMVRGYEKLYERANQ